MKRKLSFVFFTLIFLGAGLTVAEVGVKPTYRAGEKRSYFPAALESFLTPGLKLVIQNVAINGTSVAVTFQITDDAGQGLDRLGIQTPDQSAPVLCWPASGPEIPSTQITLPPS